jgi:hypoxanthine phosphoribosyltransferase
LANQINSDYKDKELVVVCVLNGAFVFCSDLIRKIDQPIYVDFVKVSSYGDQKVSSGNLKVDLDLKVDIQGKHVLVVEDIVDTGLTLSCLMEKFNSLNPASLKLASFLHKPDKTKFEVPIDYLGFEIPDSFVIGYGLDYAGLYRELPYLGVLE